MKGFLLGIDIGTSSCKTVLFDLSGAVVASASREYKTIFGDAGIAEQEPQLWWEALCSTIHTICAETGIAADEILAVGLDTQSSAFIPLDAQGNVLHNALIWTDHRARDQQMWLEKNVDSARQLAINGNRFDSSNVGTKALWWKQLHPAMYEKTAVMLNASGYLVYRLTGKYTCNISEADLSQLSNQQTCSWSAELMDAYGLDINKFPPIYNSTDIVGKVSSCASVETGLSPGTPVTAGTMDVCSTALGSHVCNNGDAVITGGTVTGIALCSDQFVQQQTAHVYHHMLKDRWLYCASIDYGGGSLRWFRDQFMDDADRTRNLYDVMDKMALGIPSGSDGLLFLPYMVGQRCPEWDSNMTGVFFGLRPQHTKAHCIRAIMEGTAFGIAKIAQMFCADGLMIRKLMIAGGCTKSDVWMDIYSQVLARTDMYHSHSQELAALGSAIGAGLALGVYSDLEDAVACCHVEELRYHEHNRERYARFSTFFNSLYPAMRDSFFELSKLINGI